MVVSLSRRDLPPIYLLRHGETTWNAAGRFQGALDSDLTMTGKAQAHALGVALARELGEHHTRWVMKVSPLGRTRTTATIIADQIHEISSEEDPLLIEVTLGSWDGLTQFEIDTEYPGLLAGASPFDWFFRSPDGEGFEHAYQRAGDWLASVNQPTIAVSHGLFGRLIRGVYRDLQPADMLQLPVPQDSCLMLHGGKETVLPP